MGWNCSVSSSFRRSVRLGELILAPTTDVRLQGVINVEFFLRNAVTAVWCPLTRS